MLTASHFPDRAAGAISVAGIDVAASGYPNDGEPAWMWRGRAVPYADNLRDVWINPGPAAIDVWHIDGPIVLICGRSDPVLSSCSSAEDIEKRLAKRDRPSPTLLAYQDVGHEITAITPGVFYPPADNPGALGRARADVWPKFLAHLETLENSGSDP